MYWIYVFYGFSGLGVFSTVVSSLDYLIQEMPGHSPSFFVGIALNLFVGIMQVFVIVYGHLVHFKIKNNLMILIQIPMTLLVPLGCVYFDTPDARFYCFAALMVSIGAVNSL